MHRSGVPGMSGRWGRGLFIITLAVQEATRRFAGPWLASCECRRTVVQSPCLETHVKKKCLKGGSTYTTLVDFIYFPG